MQYKLNSGFKNFESFVKNIQTYFKQNNETIHKARNELKILNYNETSVVVKSFKVPHFINKIVYTFFKDSKAKKSYDYSIKIGDFTPKPIAYVEFFKWGLLHKSYFISEEFKYDFTIREPLLDDDFEDKELILRAFARFTLKLHEHGIYHNDYSPGNILIKKESNEYSFKIVDINRMKFYALDDESRARNFSKLWARDDELEIISNEYLKHYQSNIDFAKQVCYYSNKNKDIKNFKKRLKGQKVTD